MSKQRRNLLIASVMIAGLVIPVTRATAYEQPGYDVVEKDGAYEVRKYEPYVVAETTVSGESEQVSSQAFRRLFAYISGKNRKQVRPHDPKIAMTVPVTMQYDSESTRMTFMLPGKYTLETAPQPADPQVELRAEPGGLVAAFTYSGRSSRERFREREGLLETWVTSKGLEPAGEPLFAQYNGPFTPWFLRRNEVLLPLAPEKAN
jgi:DNA gyrase inhibitor GyrI